MFLTRTKLVKKIFNFAETRVNKQVLMKKNIKFRFNPEKLIYERIEHSFGHRFKSFFNTLLLALFLSIVLFFCYYYFFDSPKEERLRQENATMALQYELLNEQVKDIQAVMNDLQDRDDNLYRIVFQADPIPYAVRKGEIGGVNRYERLQGMSNADIMIETSKNIDHLAREVYLQSKSYDKIVDLAINHETKLKHIPAIQPVLNKDLTRVASGYGRRIDPIYHRLKMHEGMDFTAPIGTEVFVTGNGVVTFAGWQQGYGNIVKVDHGFGYETRYAHLSRYKVKVGQKVSRGDVIAFVGNTGKSTGPHLHYEVRYKGEAQNPHNYYFLDLSPEEYDLMVQLSNNAGQVLD